ncbi:hypothetical protein [Metabacillus malikii]|uniref:Uncharacterized protein n=1 Tax=Metabacillus malikii TaxID=1504265 RepID=A0ABT9ZA87_9BACI|nr:hypothetical protein [Metabacillus malikii]MDQ0228945.1 hypothetical protein [Metabacillus malikii]
MNQFTKKSSQFEQDKVVSDLVKLAINSDKTKEEFKNYLLLQTNKVGKHNN